MLSHQSLRSPRLFSYTTHLTSKTAVVQTSFLRPTLSYLFENNKTYKAQSVVPASLLPVDFTYKGAKAIVSPERIVIRTESANRNRRRSLSDVPRQRTHSAAKAEPKPVEHEEEDAKPMEDEQEDAIAAAPLQEDAIPVSCLPTAKQLTPMEEEEKHEKAIAFAPLPTATQLTAMAEEEDEEEAACATTAPEAFAVGSAVKGIKKYQTDIDGPVPVKNVRKFRTSFSGVAPVSSIRRYQSNITFSPVVPFEVPSDLSSAESDEELPQTSM